MTCDRFTEAIGALIDGALDPAGRRALDEHLESCAACRGLAADFRRIHREAAGLPRMTPPETLWMKVQERLETQMAHPHAETARSQAGTPAGDGQETARASNWERLAAWFRPMTASPLRAAALSSAVVLLLAVATVLVLFRQQAIAPSASLGLTPGAATVTQPTAGGQPATGGQPAAGNAPDDQLVQSVEMELRLAEQHYEKAIAGLELVAKADQGSLDPQLAAVLQKNLGIIDQAILESRVALQSQPTNQLAQASLFEAFRRKVALLQDTITLINEMRKGDQAGAARVLQNLNRS